jgi:hypothetical protein
LAPLEVAVASDIRHVGKHFGKAASARPEEGCGEDRAVFGFGTAAVTTGALFQRADDRSVNISDKQIGHDVSLHIAPDDINDIVPGARGVAGPVGNRSKGGTSLLGELRLVPDSGPIESTSRWVIKPKSIGRFEVWA